MCSILSPVPPLVSVVGSPTVVPKYALAFIFITLPPKFKAELELPIVNGKYVLPSAEKESKNNQNHIVMKISLMDKVAYLLIAMYP